MSFLNSKLSNISTDDLQSELAARTRIVTDKAWKVLRTNPNSKDLWYKAWSFARRNAKDISLSGYYQLNMEIGYMRCATGTLCVRDNPHYNKTNFKSSGMEKPIDIEWCKANFKM